MTLDVDIIYTNDVVVNLICNFTIDKFFNWKYVLFQIYLCFKILRFWNFQTIMVGQTTFIKFI
jgi:hypothetical protein